MEDKTQLDVANEISKDGNFDLILINGPINTLTQDRVISKLKERKLKRENLMFILCTSGGSADAAYRISRAFQDQYSSVVAYIAGWCKSAGTLCVIGANTIIMSDEAELGPLDVQIAKRDEIGERDSGLVVSEALMNLERHAFSLFENFMLQIKERSGGTVSLKMAAEISAMLTKGLFEPIYRQIDPEKLGATARSLSVARDYGLRLNLTAENLKKSSIDKLGIGYQSHGFVIDRREAEALFIRVKKPSDNELLLVQKIGSKAMYPTDNASAASVDFLNSERENEVNQNRKDESNSPEKKRAKRVPSKSVRRAGKNIK